MNRRHRLLRLVTTVVAAAAALLLALSSAAPAMADTIRDREYWLADYGFENAWQLTRGAGVTVAVIDTGIDGSIPELAGAVVGGTDVSGLGSPDGQTPIGASNKAHGTLVASMLAGRGSGEGGENGIIGVAPAASLLSVSVYFGESPGGVTSDDQIAQAVRWAVDHGASVINMSLTRNSLQWPESWDDAFQYAFDHDVVVVAAAGNRGGGTTEVGAPATIPGVLTVAGVDRGGKASFDASSQGMTIAVSAPSEDLVGAMPKFGYATWDGTSGAAPLVSGLVALVRARFPDLDAANVINRVISTAKQVGDEAHSPIYGYGLIDAFAALTADVPEVDANPMGDLNEWIRLYRRAETTPNPEPDAEPSVSLPEPLPLPPPDDGVPDAAAQASAAVNEVVIPLAMVVGFGSLVVLGAVGATRDFKRSLTQAAQKPFEPPN